MNSSPFPTPYARGICETRTDHRRSHHRRACGSRDHRRRRARRVQRHHHCRCRCRVERDGGYANTPVAVSRSDADARNDGLSCRGSRAELRVCGCPTMRSSGMSSGVRDELPSGETHERRARRGEAMCRRRPNGGSVFVARASAARASAEFCRLAARTGWTPLFGSTVDRKGPDPVGSSCVWRFSRRRDQGRRPRVTGMGLMTSRPACRPTRAFTHDESMGGPDFQTRYGRRAGDPLEQPLDRHFGDQLLVRRDRRDRTGWRTGRPRCRRSRRRRRPRERAARAEASVCRAPEATRSL